MTTTAQIRGIYANANKPLNENPIIEHVGKCIICGKIGLLGNGLCIHCWDADPLYINLMHHLPRVTNPVCISCGSDRVNKKGVSNGGLQRYKCRVCKKTWCQP